jgi:outer membrane lipoprotein-sorting protein
MVERKPMQLARKPICFALMAASFLLARPAHADDLQQVLARLDAAARDFHTTSATVEFDTIQTDPVPDTDVMTGIAYYERKGNTFQMAAHLHQENKRPIGKTYIFSNGVLRESDTGKESDAKTYNQASKYESYLMLGFGASGKDLAEKWDIKYLGQDKTVTTEKGAPTDKLELVAKDPTVRKNIPKVTVWFDADRAVSLKQIFDEGEGQSRVSRYTDIKVNQPLPAGAFAFDK